MQHVNGVFQLYVDGVLQLFVNKIITQASVKNVIALNTRILTNISSTEKKKSKFTVAAEKLKQV